LSVSQLARATADSCLLASLAISVDLRPGSISWHQGLFFLVAPVLLIAPWSGAIADCFPRRWCLVGSALWCLCAASIIGLWQSWTGDLLPWQFGWPLAALGAVFYSAMRYSLLPAAARDMRRPLGRVTGWVEALEAAGMAAGIVLSRISMETFPIIVGLNLVSVLAAFFVWFPSDLRGKDSLGEALAQLPGEWTSIGRVAQTRDPLLSLALFLGLIAASLAALAVLDPQPRAGLEDVLCAAVGLTAGFLLAAGQDHPRRALGLIPFGALALVAGLTWGVLTGDFRVPCFLLGLAAGWINVPLRSAYLAALSAGRRGAGTALMSTTNYCLVNGACLLVVAAGGSSGALPWGLIVLAVLAAAWAWYTYLREALEQILEMLLWPIYRVKVHGPGFCEFPSHGPVLIVANHTAWFDPLWLAKVTPRQVTPMMTSAFYDLPILRFLMERIVHAIRVPAGTFRREAPELQEGIAVLDGGGCLVIFPEGFLKRRPEHMLHFFAQGVWRILSQRPHTPVVACWIEGGWGSYTSYQGAPPMVGKPIDCWRRIDIGMSQPQILSSELLADHRATRMYLMQACLKARGYLGLALPAEALHAEEDRSDDREPTV
jgi:1-acyl-sn-glycerol-3-phosphate acyltransferase